MTTKPVYARIDSELKDNAEAILSKLGITTSNAIQMLYSQIVLTNGFPLDLKLPAKKPVAIASMNDDELADVIMAGIESEKKDKVYSSKEVDEILKNKFGI